MRVVGVSADAAPQAFQQIDFVVFHIGQIHMGAKRRDHLQSHLVFHRCGEPGPDINRQFIDQRFGREGGIDLGLVHQMSLSLEGIAFLGQRNASGDHHGGTLCAEPGVAGGNGDIGKGNGHDFAFGLRAE